MIWLANCTLSFYSSDPDYLSLDEYVFNTEAHPLQLPLSNSKTHPESFTPSWQASRLDEQLQQIHDDPMEADSNAVGTGTWVQKQLSKLAFAKYDH